MYREPEAWHDLMERLSTMIVAYLRAQVEAGARGRPALRQLGRRPRAAPTTASSSSPTSRRIFAALRRRADASTSGPGTAALLGAHGRGRRRRHRARPPGRRSPTPGERIGHERGVQGNLDAARLLAGWAATEAGALAVLDEAAGPAGPRLQPGPRRPARRRTPTCSAGSSTSSTRRPPGPPPRPRWRVTDVPARRPADDLRLAGLARARGHPRLPRRASAAGASRTPELVDEFTRRYRVIGGSPLIEITRGPGRRPGGRRSGWPVATGMRFSEPSIVDRPARAGRRRRRRGRRDHPVAAVLAAAHGRLRAGDRRRPGGDRAIGARGRPSPGRGTDQPAFVAALAGRVARPSSGCPPTSARRASVLMTAHSLPRRVADQEPDYLDQLRATAEAVALGGRPDRRPTGRSAGRAPVTSRASG